MKRYAAMWLALGSVGALVVVATIGAGGRPVLALAMLLPTALMIALGWREFCMRRRTEETVRRMQHQLETRMTARLTELNTINVALQAEVAERQRAEEELHRSREALESRVTERTRELAAVNEYLQREIEERRRIAEALKSSRTLYHSLVENLPVNVWRTDLEGRFSFGNDHLCDCLGVTPEDFLGRTAADFFAPSSAEKSARDDRWVLETGDPYEDTEEFATRTGRRGFQQVLKTPFHDSHGRVVGVQGIGWDVTERQRAEAEMRRIQAELERMNRDLTSRNEEIQNFYHTLSHELKTPLTSAREFIAIVRDNLAGPINDTQREYLGIAFESCNQLRVCINDLLDTTRLETGKLSIDLKAVSLGALARRVVTAMGSAAIGQGITLTGVAEEELPAILLDESRITQVVTNLLNNAIKFTPSGGRIELRMGANPARPGWQEVSVRDTGRGIPAEQLDRIFDRLYQVRTGDATTEQGVGLGLYLCRELVRLHGGDIRVESAVGVGSTFTFTLPPAPPETRSHVLVVDDDPGITELLQRVLEKQDFSVATAADGDTALALLWRRRADVVLMDLEMPGRDGPSTLQEIRRHFGAVPVIVHTGQPEGGLMTRALEWSPFTLLAKPCPLEQVVETVRSLDRRTRHSLVGAPAAGVSRNRSYSLEAP